MRRLIVLSCAWLLVSAVYQPAHARPVLVELFTSQGCSSCPPADNFLIELADLDGVVALGMHVDYWDYLGWPDTLALAEFSQRQSAYNERLKSRYRLVTPQMIVQGNAQFAGVQKSRVIAAIAALRDQPDPVVLEAERDGERLLVRMAPKRDSAVVCSRSAPCSLYAAEVVPVVPVAIKRGENHGRNIRYVNVVESWKRLTRWDGKSWEGQFAGFNPEVQLAVILQERDTGQVFGVRHLD
ncbi:MAG: DUF1223 domain-containing protein [Paracoccaceae bacterium]|nr:DUF1223 domain-containing protein [Paracoccaceae bacterium]